MDDIATNDVMVCAEGVRKHFGRQEVLRGIDLQVRTGEVLCIIGPSGSGKSTFLRCINHLEKIDGGRLTVAGELVGYREHSGKLYELKDREVGQRRAEVGMVFQHFNLFPHMTVARERHNRAGQGEARRKDHVGGPGPGAVETGRAWVKRSMHTQGSCRVASSNEWPSPALSACSPS